MCVQQAAGWLHATPPLVLRSVANRCCCMPLPLTPHCTQINSEMDTIPAWVGEQALRCAALAELCTHRLPASLRLTMLARRQPFRHPASRGRLADARLRLPSPPPSHAQPSSRRS